MTFAIVTDGTSDLPSEMAKARHIHVVPLYVIFGTQSYKDGIDIKSAEFYRRIEKEHPKTSQPTAADFVEGYRKAKEAENAEQVLAIVVSSGVSGTYNSAIQAAGQVDFKVEVIDSQIASIALGFLALTAADMRDAGKSFEETVTAVRAAVPKVEIYFTVATLEYLRRGGRIGGAQKFIGEALKIKPIMYAKNGQVESKDKVRTAKRALARLIEILHEQTDGKKIKRLGIMHANADEDVEELKKELAEFNAPELIVTTVCSAVGTHGGPGLYGVAYEVE
jgi:DegV family protein with EDD domain